MTHLPGSVGPEVSFIMPCYNEEQAIQFTIPQFVQAFAKAGIRLELVACDNGSTDRTGEIIRQFIADGLPVVLNRLDLNQGFGNGVLSSVKYCTAPWIGVIPADGQVDAEDAVRLFDTVRHSDGMVIGKVRRRFRMDGAARKMVSVLYNVLVACLWPGLGSFDINGNPKIVHRDVLSAMDLQSKKWFLDAEMMVKAHYLRVRVLEVNVFARMRSNGLSHVRPAACWEFLTKLIGLRFGIGLSEWRRSHPAVRPEGPARKAAPLGSA